MNLSLCSTHSAAQAQEKQGSPASDSNGDKLRQAKELFDKALAWEATGEYAQAVENYRRVQQLFPANPLVRYRLGICLQRLHRTDEAVKSLREFLQTSYDGPETADGRSRLEELLLPALSPQQRRKWEEASDYLQVASESQLRITSDLKEPPQPKSLDEAIALLRGLERDVPGFLPIQARLGYALQQKGDLEQAIVAYDKYLKGFQKLDFEPQDLRDIRRRRIACAERIAIEKSDREMKTEMGRKAEEQRLAAKKAEDTKIQKRRYLRDHGSCVITGTVSKVTQNLSFDGDLMIINSQNGDDPTKISGVFSATWTVDVKDIDDTMLRFRDISQPEYNRVAFNVYIDLTDPAKTIKYDGQSKALPSDPLTPFSMVVHNLAFYAPDQKAARGIVASLRELIILSRRE